jgi:hypothetical protein
LGQRRTVRASVGRCSAGRRVVERQQVRLPPWQIEQAVGDSQSGDGRSGGRGDQILGDRFELAGGSIRACAVTAAYLAAESAGPLTMRQLVTAVAQEYRKLGRLVLEGEFGPYLAEATGA